MYRKRLIALGVSTFVCAFVSNHQLTHAATLTFSQNPNPFAAVEGSPGNIGFLNIVNSANELYFITNIAVSTLVHFGGEFDDQAKNLVLIAPKPSVSSSLGLASGGNFNIKFSWDAVDDIKDNDVDFGDWLAAFTITGHLAGGADQFDLVAAKLRVLDPVPLPAALPLFGTGLGLLGLLGWRRKWKKAAA